LLAPCPEDQAFVYLYPPEAGWLPILVASYATLPWGKPPLPIRKDAGWAIQPVRGLGLDAHQHRPTDEAVYGSEYPNRNISND
jgi:hypothetical protein